MEYTFEIVKVLGVVGGVAAVGASVSIVLSLIRGDDKKIGRELGRRRKAA